MNGVLSSQEREILEALAGAPGAAEGGTRVLDVCCGSRMFWFDKGDPRALFLDKRREVCLDPRGREVVVDPDVLGDFTALPFGNDTFSLVVFDPPHTFNGANSAMAQKYGRLEHGWREQITAGFAECFRVLTPGGNSNLQVERTPGSGQNSIGDDARKTIVRQPLRKDGQISLDRFYEARDIVMTRRIPFDLICIALMIAIWAGTFYEIGRL